MKKLALIFTAALLVCSCGQKANEADKALIASLDSLFTADYAADGPGAAVIVLRGNDVIFDKGYGVADLGTGAKIDGNTFFNIASMSKQFTAVAIMQLAEQGLLSVTDPVTKYCPEFTDPIWEGIEIRHLLAHSSGIPDARGNYSREEKVQATDELALAYMDTLSFVNFAPGEEYEYMNPTFVLLGEIVSRVSGQEFGEYMHDHVFVPAGMEQTLYYVPGQEENIPDMAHGYDLNSETGEWTEDDFGESTFFATRPDGGIYTSTHEFVKWELALREGKVISAESLREAMTPKTAIDENESYCYGWINQTSKIANKVVIYHNGGNGGFRSTGLRYPEDQILVAVFCNRDDFEWFVFKDKVEKMLF